MLTEESLIYFVIILLLEIINGQCFNTIVLGRPALGRATETHLKKEGKQKKKIAKESVPFSTHEQKANYLQNALRTL